MVILLILLIKLREINMTGIVWFRKDLRTEDNKALFHAAEKHESIIGLYLLDLNMWKLHQVSDCQISFILEGLKVLISQLKKYNIPLIVEKLETKEIPDKILTLMKLHKAESLYFNRQYELDEKRRDLSVTTTLKKNGFSCHEFDDQIILPPSTVQTNQGTTFKVFTSFKKAWYQKILSSKPLKLLPPPREQKCILLIPEKVPAALKNIKYNIDNSLWPAGETSARKKLTDFIKNQAANYHLHRDFPGLSGTSLLSPYLATGMISPRQCLIKALEILKDQDKNKGIETWINELIWRDFYKDLLDSFPRLSMNQPFKLNTKKIKWRFDHGQWSAWEEGMTGFPIIDAGMRQLKQIGWMHNRVRMIVAMFLTKNLLIDWRLGEKHFISHLIDGDLAANNGGWQWSASTGTDAAPYFRIFNPTLQSQRYDPEGKYIRQYCPELASFDNRSIHDPHYFNAALAKKTKYPQPIIDLKFSRARAIEAFKAIL